MRFVQILVENRLKMIKPERAPDLRRLIANLAFSAANCGLEKMD